MSRSNTANLVNSSLDRYFEYRISAIERDAYWEFIERLYLSTTDKSLADWVMPGKPVSVPWLAVAILGLQHDPDAAEWLGDFERCMTWLLIEDVYRETN